MESLLENTAKLIQKANPTGGNNLRVHGEGVTEKEKK